MTDKKAVEWTSYSWDELGEFADEIRDLKARMTSAYAEDNEVDVAQVRVAFSKLGAAFAVVPVTAAKPKKLLGSGAKKAPAAKPKTFGPRSPRLK
jgi:hypothetical protein